MKEHEFNTTNEDSPIYSADTLTEVLRILTITGIVSESQVNAATILAQAKKN